MSLADELRKLEEHLGFIGRQVALSTKGAQLLKTMVAVEPEDAERYDLMKRCWGKAIHSGIPDELRVGDRLDIEHQERASHGAKLPEKPRATHPDSRGARYGWERS